MCVCVCGGGGGGGADMGEEYLMVEIGVHEYAKLIDCRCMRRVLTRMQSATISVFCSYNKTN